MRSLGAVFLLAAAMPAQAFFFKSQLKETIGSGQYYATYASVDVGSDLHVQPSLNAYHSSTSSGTTYTGSIRVGYDWENYGFGLTGGLTPWNNGYKNRFAGGDVWWNWDAEDAASEEANDGRAEHERKRGITSVGLTASLTETNHTEENASPIVKVGGAFVQLPANQTDADQTDVGAGVAVGYGEETFGLNVTKSIYNKDLSKIGFQAQGVQRLAGLVSTIQGFPDLNASVRVGYEGWDLASPYVSYTYTRYKLSQPNSAAYDIGVYTRPSKTVKVDFSYERFAKAGAADISYWSAAVRLKF